MKQRLKTQNADKARPLDADALPAGVVGLGVMGAVITTCLLAAGHPVYAVAFEDEERRSGKSRVKRHLKALYEAGVLREAPNEVLPRLQIGAAYSALASCRIVIESIIEDLGAKREVMQNVENVVSAQTLIGSNTSALPISEIQRGAQNPKRVLGLHWVSSSPFGCVVEVMGGEQTSRAATQRAVGLVRLWGKTPALSRRDKRGFICNRVGYAVLRECCALLDEGVATPAEIDAAVRASLGTWLPFVGPFGYLDLSGLPAYAPIMCDIFPDLSCNQEIPKAMHRLMQNGAQGIANGRGFYKYARGEGERKRRDFDDFRRDLSTLMANYQAGQQASRSRKNQGNPKGKTEKGANTKS